VKFFSYSFPIIFCLFVTLGLTSCTDDDSGPKRTIRGTADLWLFRNFGKLAFNTVAKQDLRSVHLAGAEQLNHDVMISGKVEVSGDLGTYIVLSDGGARMLVDTTLTNAYSTAETPKIGSQVIVHGIVKTAENGHIYVVASAAREGHLHQK
jgi:hypothetical protein